MPIATADLIAQLEESIEDHRDPSWILALDDVDEPPLFNRIWQVDALYQVPPVERGPILLSMALTYLSSIVDLVATLEKGTRCYFSCVTISDFDYFAAGEQAVATMAILVDPHYERISKPPELVRPRSPQALQVVDWIRTLGPEADARFVAGEIWPPPPIEMFRVYVGLRNSPCASLRSVGDEIREPSPGD